MDLGPPEPERAGSIRANFLDSSGTAFFELTLHAISSFGHSSPRAFDIAGLDFAQRPESALPAQRGGISGVSRRRRRARSAPRPPTEGLRCGNRRIARGREAAVSQLSAHRSPLSPGACAFRQRDHRGRDLSGGRGAGARGSPRRCRRRCAGGGGRGRPGGWRGVGRLHRARSSRAGADRPRAGRGLGASGIRHHRAHPARQHVRLDRRRRSGDATSLRTASTTTSPTCRFGISSTV